LKCETIERRMSAVPSKIEHIENELENASLWMRASSRLLKAFGSEEMELRESTNVLEIASEK
jgi:hypothetical protein